MKHSKINIITLGCSKNIVDSENLATQLKNQNIEFTFDEFNFNADTVVINTCGFIADAKEESVNTILEFAEAKNEGKIENLYVIGCLSERYKDELAKDIEEVDRFFGVNELKDIIEQLKVDYKKELIGERVISTPKHYAYFKISEGCDRTCAFCAIPLIRGKHRSVPFDTLIEQAQNLASQGVKELILIAQDLTYYGVDIYKEQRLAQLVEALSDIRGIEMIRLHYAYPTSFPEDVLKVMNERQNVANYIDIPLQHISDPVLQRMKRNYSKEKTYALLKKFREMVPGIAVRTTLLVGFPGETEEDFEELKQFVKDIRFERLGVFTYSEEEDTSAGDYLEDDVDDEIKQARASEIMQIQQQISYEINQSKIGKSFRVIIDKETADHYIGRTQYDSPEVDNEVLIDKTKELTIGEMYSVTIRSAEDFDLYASIQE
jgi:ribosomal protein S12 methylthiotransferase